LYDGFYGRNRNCVFRKEFGVLVFVFVFFLGRNEGGAATGADGFLPKGLEEARGAELVATWGRGHDGHGVEANGAHVVVRSHFVMGWFVYQIVCGGIKSMNLYSILLGDLRIKEPDGSFKTSLLLKRIQHS
jgi:hypothetical protein